MRHPLRVAAVAAAVLLVGTACGSGGPGGSESGAPASAAGQAPALNAALPAAVKDAGVIRFAGDSHPPYRTVGSDGAVTGIDKDMQDALGRILGVKTEISIVDSLPSALQGMLSNRYDAFNGPVKATAEREKQFDSITWMTTKTSYVVPKASAAGIASTDDLCGKKVAIVTASIVEGQLNNLSAYCQKNGKAATEAVPLADTNATLLAAQSGRADAAGMTQAAAIDVTTQQKDAYSYVTQTEAQGATTDKLALLVPKSGGLGPVMLDAYKQLFTSGEYQQIMQKWGLSDVTVPEPVLNAGSAG
jgi:polar amino acid transport system substrate-binding protein